jgi:hypothetical protein
MFTCMQTQCSSWRPSSSRRFLRSVVATRMTNRPFLCPCHIYTPLCSIPFVCPIRARNDEKARSFHSIQAAATTCYVAAHPAVAGVSGKYFADCNEASPSRLGASCEEAARLWAFSENVTAEKVQRTTTTTGVHVAVGTGLLRPQAHQSSDADRAMALAA